MNQKTTSNKDSNLNTDKQSRKHHAQGQKFPWLAQYRWQKGQSGNPNGRPKGKSLKEFARNYLENMSDEARLKYLEGLDPHKIWEMAEGKPKQDVDLKGDVVSKIVKLDE